MASLGAPSERMGSRTVWQERQTILVRLIHNPKSLSGTMGPSPIAPSEFGEADELGGDNEESLARYEAPQKRGGKRTKKRNNKRGGKCTKNRVVFFNLSSYYALLCFYPDLCKALKFLHKGGGGVFISTTPYFYTQGGGGHEPVK